MTILISAVRYAAIITCVLAAGCADVAVAPPDTGKPVEPPALSPSTPSASVSSPILAATATPAITPAPPRSQPEREAKTAAAPAPAAAAPAKKPAAVKEATVKAVPVPKTAASAKANAKTAPAKPVVTEPARNEAPPPVARKAEPTLDVAGLTTRLGETKAIGVFTKLALKNQMDDLLDRFRAVYQSGQKAGVTALRQPFEALVVKVVTQLRPGDPSLARTIEGSREAIWGILSDPEKFKSVT